MILAGPLLIIPLSLMFLLHGSAYVCLGSKMSLTESGLLSAHERSVSVDIRADDLQP